MKKIKIAIIGIGNCTSSLVQGIEYYKNKNAKDAIGLMHWDIGGYMPGDIEVVAGGVKTSVWRPTERAASSKP